MIKLKPKDINYTMSTYLKKKLKKETIKNSDDLMYILTNDNKSYREILNEVGSDIPDEEFYETVNEFMETDPFKKERKGIAELEGDNIRVSYTVDTDGMAHWLELEDLNTYLFNNVNEGKYSNLDNSKLVINAFSKAYPVIPNKGVVCFDLKLIADKSEGKLSLYDVARYFYRASKCGFYKVVKTRLNVGNIHTIFMCKIEHSDYMYLDGESFDTCIKVPTHKGVARLQDMFKEDTDLSEEDVELSEIRYNVRTPHVLYSNHSLHLMPDGSIGYILNSLFIGAKIKYISNRGVSCDIVAIHSNKKWDCFSKVTHGKEVLRQAYDDKMSEKIYNNHIIVYGFTFGDDTTLCSKLFSEQNDKKSRNIMSLESGWFITPSGSNIKGIYIYDKDTKWHTIKQECIEYTERRGVRLETEREKIVRENSISSIESVIGKNTNIDGMWSSYDSIKYSKTVLDSIGGSVPLLTSKDIDDMLVTDVTQFALYLTIIKPYMSYISWKIDLEMKDFKGMVVDELCAGYNGIAYNPMIMENRDNFTMHYINRKITELIDSGIYFTNPELEDTIKSIRRIRNKEVKVQEVFSKLNKYINLDEIEDTYNTMKLRYDYLLEQISEFKHINDLNGRYRMKLARFYHKYNKATGKRLPIQNFKINVIDLTSDIINDNKEYIKRINNKEAKTKLKELNKSLRRHSMTLRKNILKETIFADYKTNKKDIKLNEINNEVKTRLQDIVTDEYLINNGYDMSRIIKLQGYVADIENRMYEIEDGDIYSNSLGNLNNTFVRVDWQRRFGFIM